MTENDTLDGEAASASEIDSFEALVAQLEDEEISYTRAEEETAVILPTKLGEEKSYLHIRWEPTPGIVEFVQPLPFEVPDNRHWEVWKAISEINFELPVLGFVFNPEDGVISFRTQTYLGPEGIPLAFIGALIQTSVKTAAQCIPQLKAAVFGGRAGSGGGQKR